MAELRRDPLRGHHVLIAPERSLRPDDFRRPPRIILGAERNPFLPGNEGDTPPEVDSVRRNDSPPNGPGWSVRVFPNRFSALSLAPGPVLTPGSGVGLFAASEAYGVQEVIVTSPDPERPIAMMQIDEIDQVLSLTQHRLATLGREERIQYTLLFENRGPEAGASRHHPHWQLFAMESLPPGVMELRIRARQHFQAHERNLFDDVLQAELSARERIVREDASFITYCPYASRMPYEVLVMPRAQSYTFMSLPPPERRRFAVHLRDVIQRMDRTLGRPPYNLMLHTALDSDMLDRESFRWHVEIVPRVTTPGGLEWTGQMYINATAPEAAAVDMRRA